MVTEQTQFSMSELDALRKSRTEMGASFAALNKREQAMVAFLDAEANKVIDFSKVGNIGNIQRVRVLADPAKPEERRFEFVTKLPVGMLEDKLKKQEREDALAAFKLLLLTDPKKAEEFLKKKAYKVFDRLVTLALLETAKGLQKPVRAPRPARAAKPQPKPVRGPRAKQGTYAIPAKAIDAYALALEQDRLNRIKASKEAAAALRKKAS